MVPSHLPSRRWRLAIASAIPISLPRERDRQRNPPAAQWRPTEVSPFRTGLHIGATKNLEEEWGKFEGKTIVSDRWQLPVMNVSVNDAERYCAWLTQKDPDHTYRLPTEVEWELAVGYMLKDAKLDCGVGVGDSMKLFNGHTMTNYKSNGIVVWNNYWELTSTKSGEGMVVVKGVVFSSKCTDRRAEICTEGRRIVECCTNVTFRIVREDR